MKRRIFSLIIVLAVLGVCIPSGGAEEKAGDEKVTLIVEVKGDAGLETADAVLMGASASHTARIMSVWFAVCCPFHRVCIIRR